MSLQFDSYITQYAKSAAKLWDDWRTLNYVGRFNTAVKAIKKCTHFLPPIDYQFYYTQQLGDYGAQYPALWRIDINLYHATHNDLNLKYFLEWVTTPYHESRHAEQTYRIAQGVLAGEITLPGKDLAKKIQAAMKGKSIREITQALNSQNPFEVVDPITRQQIVQKWLDVPDVVVRHADVHRSYFKTYLQSNRPSWYDSRTVEPIKNAVIDWMKVSYERHLGELDRKAQQFEPGWERFYSRKGIPEEKDAYGIEGVVQKKILDLLGKSLLDDADDTPP